MSLSYAEVAAALMLAACGGSQAAPSDSAPKQPPVDVTVPESHDGDEPAALSPKTEEAPTNPGGACQSAYDCTLVKDHCGRIHGASLSHPVAPDVPPRCQAIRQARVRPSCVSGRCEAAQIEDPDWTTCRSTTDCTTIAWPCSGPIAVARAHRAEAEAAAAENAKARSCSAPADTQPPAVECLMTACVTRAPR